MSLQHILQVRDLSSLFHLPFSEEAFTQFQDRQQLILSFDNANKLDVWQ